MDRKKITIADCDFGLYASGEWSIEIIDREGTAYPDSLPGERLTVATVALVEYGKPRPAEGCVWLKTWSENRGIAEALVAGGVVELIPEVVIVNGFGSQAKGARLTPAALAEFERQRKGG